MRRWLTLAATTISTLFACIWAFWGAIEMFHEGWYFSSLWQNLLLSAGQYLAPAAGFVLLAAMSAKWPKVGAVCHVLLAIGAWALFGRGVGIVLIAIPLALLAAAYWFGAGCLHRWQKSAIWALPLATAVVSGAYPGYLALTRVDDGIRTARIIQGNGVRLLWAPAGPGWPDRGSDWFQAIRACECLNAEGTQVLAEPQKIWRLPRADEVVRSQVRRGQNAGGTWSGRNREQPTYATPPNKESPLWNPQSQVIYWWTATESSATHAYRAVWNGQMHPLRKSVRPDYCGFRCVRDP